MLASFFLMDTEIGPNSSFCYPNSSLDYIKLGFEGGAHQNDLSGLLMVP